MHVPPAGSGPAHHPSSVVAVTVFVHLPSIPINKRVPTHLLTQPHHSTLSSVHRNRIPLPPRVLLPRPRIVRWSSHPEAAMATVEVVVANGLGGADTKTVFKETYSKLKEEMLDDPAFEFTDESLQWIDRVMLSSPPGSSPPLSLVYCDLSGGPVSSFDFYRVFWAFGDSEDLAGH
jgi:hypothetical protein